MKPILAESYAWCDTPRRGHGNRWHMGLGLHVWVAPSKAQIATRIRRRYELAGRLPRRDGVR